jgi:RNA polymerase sigma-70 factor (ECF subfamily)
MAVAPVTEADLEAHLKSGDEARFAMLYKRFSGSLYGILTTIVRDEDEAQDLLQEAFVKIWRNSAKYKRSKGTVFTWMLNITRNQAIDFLRSKRAGQAKQSFSLEDAVYIADTIAEPDGGRTAGAEAEEYLTLLPEAQRQLMHMVYVQGYTHAEVSDKVGLPLGTVKTRIRTALQNLRRQV